LIFNTGIGLWPPKASIISKTVLEWPTTKACFPLFSFRIVAAAVFKSVALYSLISFPLFSAVGIAVFWVRL
jgi:hypothetical protein